MNERIKILRRKLDITQEEFSSKIGLSRNFIAQIESGTKTPSDRTISDICRIFSVNESWIRDGEGEIFKKRTRNQEIMAFSNSIMEDLDESFKKRFLIALSKLDKSDWETLEKISNELNKEGWLALFHYV